MATFNGANYLQAQLDSFSSQSLLPDELVVCDDGSHDRTIGILEAFRSKAPFDVQIHRNASNLGYIKNFEKALSLCGGEIIFLSDQDDVWFDQRIERVAAAFDKNPQTMVVMNDQLIVNADLKSNGVTKLENMKRYGGAQRNFITGCCSAHRREWQDIVLPIPAEAPAHDTWINGLAHQLRTAIVLPDVLQFYRRHASNASQSLISSNNLVSPVQRLRRLNPFGLGTKGKQGLEYRRAILQRINEREKILYNLGLSESAANLKSNIGHPETLLGISTIIFRSSLLRLSSVLSRGIR
ncbi:glycosyltransferase family 2 protein [Sphingosinicella rhizophila]|uniref:glycosyltransferase family 2 protein n=1 Tax=Sphingosinicella rhizophila TaxID=3050082 RepID=UPI00396584B5